jgi:hypothetical protein
MSMKTMIITRRRRRRRKRRRRRIVRWMGMMAVTRIGDGDGDDGSFSGWSWVGTPSVTSVSSSMLPEPWSSEHLRVRQEGGPSFQSEA